MMGSDARDVLGLSSAGPPKPTPAKAQKPKGRGPTGMSREVLDLKYEGAPPISIVAPKFKEKPKLPFKPRPWEETPFRNSARKDGLVLKHWRRKGDVGSVGAAMPVTPADSNAASEMETDDKSTATIPDSYWAKYNVKVERPQYTDEQYESKLKIEDWSKEETDYLVDLVHDFDLRWIVIADRYEYKPSEMPKENEDSMTVTAQAKPRTQEDMKARYYDVAAKVMIMHNPQRNMSIPEFDTYEKMTKYNPVQETQRKKYAEQLMQRTDEEKHEEEMLLKELSRIVNSQEKLYNERKSLYDRLEPAHTLGRESFSTAMYQSSQGLTQLMSNLLTQSKNRELEKKEKRRSFMEAGDIPSGLDRSQRHSLGGAEKRASASGEPGRRQLSARDELKYGVSHPDERLTAGVQFRHERVIKAGQAKSYLQTTKISAALTELKIPPRLGMPTAKVITEYEKLMEHVRVLVEVRKLRDKLDGEIKVWQHQKETQQAKDRGEEVKEEEPSQPNQEEAEEEEEETLKLETTRNNEENAKVEDDDNEASDDEDNKDEEEKDESDEEANQEESNNDSEDGEDVEADADAEADEDDMADEMRDLQEDEEGETQEQEREGDALEGEGDVEGEDNEDEDDAMGELDDEGATSERASPAPTVRSATQSKRSASVISHVSNRSSKRQRK